MATARSFSSDIAFTPAVKAVQARRGSRRAYSRMEEGGGWQTTITPELAAFVAAQYVALELLEATPNGWLRVRHADGAAGFVRAAQVWGN